MNLRRVTKDELGKTEIFVTEAHTSDRYRVDIEPGDIWIDLGSNIGLFGLYAFGKGAVRAYCYEADPRTIPLLGESIETRIKFVAQVNGMAVIAGPAGEVTVYRPTDPKHTWRSRLEPHIGKRAGGTSVVVQAVPFQSVLDA